MKEPTDLMMEWGTGRYERAMDSLIAYTLGEGNLSDDAKELRDALKGVEDGTGTSV